MFHLFDALSREGAQLVFGAGCPPSELDGLEDRLRSRLEAGLVADLGSAPAADGEGSLAELGLDPAAARGDTSSAEAAAQAATSAARDASAPLRGGRDDWFRSTEKLIWVWPYAADWVIEELA